MAGRSHPADQWHQAVEGLRDHRHRVPLGHAGSVVRAPDALGRPGLRSVGLLYFVSILPLSYFFYYFHPWDRMSQLFWVLLFLCVKTGRTSAFAVALAASMLVKFDTVLVPRSMAGRRDAIVFPAGLAANGGAFAVSFSVLGVLVLQFPDAPRVRATPLT